MEVKHHYQQPVGSNWILVEFAFVSSHVEASRRVHTRHFVFVGVTLRCRLFGVHLCARVMRAPVHGEVIGLQPQGFLPIRARLDMVEARLAGLDRGP